jgi:pantothenate kinase
VDSDLESIYPRLIARHQAGGKTPPDAQAKVESTDLPNALLIERTKHLATRIVIFSLPMADAVTT